MPVRARRHELDVAKLQPATGLLYLPTVEQCDTYMSSARTAEPMKNFAGTGGESISKEPGRIYLRALDPRTGEKRWEYPMTGHGDMWAGTVSTAHNQDRKRIRHHLPARPASCRWRRGGGSELGADR